MRFRSLLTLTLLTLTLWVSGAHSAPSQSAVIDGKVVGVTDGDTITVLDKANVQHKIRLEGIDAPETRQAFGTQAKKSLSALVFGKQVRVEWQSNDRYGRTLGHIYVDGLWVNEDLIASGVAWHYKKYSTDKRLATAEDAAREKQVGLWRDKDAIPPWEFRKMPNRAATGLLASPSSQGKAVGEEHDEVVFVTKSGSKYHRDGCRSLAKSKIQISHTQAKAKYAPCSICKP